MRTRNTLMHPLLIDAILAREGAWVIEEECTDGSHRPRCLIRFGVGQTDHGCPHDTFPGMERSLARNAIPHDESSTTPTSRGFRTRRSPR